MKQSSKIFVAGASGMAGSAIIRKMIVSGYENVVGSHLTLKPGTAYFRLGHEEDRRYQRLRLVQLDLTEQKSVEHFFAREAPEYVFLAAGRVGGIQANSRFPAQFIRDNLMIQSNAIHAAYQSGVRRLLFLGSSCIYPKLAPQPMKEEHLLSGYLEPTNEPYALAKIAGIKMCEAYNRQYGTKFFAVMPTNLYGPNDNFDLENAHVLPALLRKFHEAKIRGMREVLIWGSGNPRREFLHVDDMAEAAVFLMNLDDQALDDQLLSYPKPCFLNVGSGVDGTIRKLADLIKEVVGFQGQLVYDGEKPDGTPRKLLDVSKLAALGWRPRIDLERGVRDFYTWFLENKR
jgi:GDP-L-fucose synthase